jgi:hypothetical protein
MNFQTWSLLNDFANRRHRFDPTSKTDLMELVYFKKNGRWQQGCPFYLEWPYRDIVSMCESKYTEYMCSLIDKKQKSP